MNNHGMTFKLDLGAIDRITKKISNRFEQDDKLIKKRMTLATSMVWRVAHQRRPYISKMQMKAEGRTRRVSDPNAALGVPVRTGALQASIEQKVTRTKLMTYQGEVYTKGIPYAGAMEYGTSRIAPRPFMRPAVSLNQDAIKRLFSLKVDSNL